MTAAWTAGMGAANMYASPKTSAVILTAFLACLSFLFVMTESIVSFATDLMQNRQLWEYLQLFMLNATNVTCKN